jgi:uncharacterized caspase-like protein
MQAYSKNIKNRIKFMKAFLTSIIFLLVLSLSCLSSIASAQNNYKAILIGISQYSDSDINCLAYADEDVRTFSSMLTNYSGYYSPSDITLLLNQEATKQNIMNAIIGMVKQSQKKPLDHFIFMFAGHGLPRNIKSNTTNSFLAPYDARINEFYKEASGSSSLINNETFINKAWLTKQLSSLKAKEIVLILDSCYSGARNFGELFAENLGFSVGLGKGKAEPRGVVIVQRKGAIDENQSRIAFIASSNENQPSAEYQELKHGALSYCIFEYINAVRKDTEEASTSDITVSGMYTNVAKLFDEVEVRGASLSSRHQPVLFPIPDYDSIRGMKFVSIKGNKKPRIKTGFIDIVSDPERAEVSVNGVTTGKLSNCSLELPEGQHMISLFLPQTNYMHSVMVEIRDGQHKKEKISLRGSLEIESFSDKPSQPAPKLEVYLNDEYMGKSALNLRNLAAGTHTLKVLAENVAKTRQIEIRPASPLLVRYKITREAVPAPSKDNDSDTVPF